MKLIMESWRKFIKEETYKLEPGERRINIYKKHPWADPEEEGSGYTPYTPGSLAYDAAEARGETYKKPVIDITGMGSNELGDPKKPGTIAYKLVNKLATPCTSSADCARKKGPDEWVDPLRDREVQESYR